MSLWYLYWQVVVVVGVILVLPVVIYTVWNSYVWSKESWLVETCDV